MIARLRYPKGYQFFDANGSPLALGELYYYAAGTTAPQDTYSDSAGTIANTNPIALDASGRLQVDVYLGAASDYKEVLTLAGAAVAPWPDDNIPRAAQPDWNAASGPGQILNKPALAAVATSGSYTDLSSTPAPLGVFTGDSGSGGTSGLVPAPGAGDGHANKFLSAAGGWALPGNASYTVDLVTSAATASGSTLTFPSVPANVVAGMTVADNTTSGVIPSGTVVSSTTSTAVVLSNAVAGGGVKSGDTIAFTGVATGVTNLSVSETANSVSIASSSGLGVSIPAATSTAAGVLDSARAAKIDGLATVAASGSYNDLSGKPTLGTAASLNVPATGNASISQVVFGTDTRLADSRTPLAHAASHAAIGADPLALAASQVSGIPASLAGQNLDGIARLGIGTTDAGNKLSVRGPASLFSNDADLRIAMSKGAVGNTAAFNFQDNYSTRVQFGLLGNDSFTIATSPDGSTFNNAIVATPTGAVSFPNTGGFTGAAASANGSPGLVPAPAAGQQAAFLRGDGTWASVTGPVLKLPSYTVAGLPSAATAGAGAMAWATDSTLAFNGTNLGAMVAGGGTHGTRVTSDGTNWVVG